MARYDTLDLISQVKRVESIPTSQTTFTDQDIVEMMNMELQSAIVPLISSVREEYFVVTQDTVLPAGVSSLNIPRESIGLRLRDVTFVNTNGQMSNIPRLAPEEVVAMSNFNGLTSGFSGFYLQGNTVQFFPRISVQDKTVRLSYHARPNYLCLPSSAGRVLNINVGANMVTFDGIPPTWKNGVKVDFIQADQPFEFKDDTSAPNPNFGSQPKMINVVVQAVSGFDLVLPANIVTQLAIGDIVALHGEAPVPQYVPVEAYHLLVQGTAMRCLEAMGDRQGWQNAAMKYKAVSEGLLGLINPRVEGEPKRVVNVDSIFGGRRGNSHGRW